MAESMETVSRAAPRRLYSWWWDSHITPKNSKWLQENLSDMDIKIESMIRLIEEDADSFARRAEMFYKKRPELMKLVEEFYRAYRALAERYDHVTGALRQAHRTISVAFPNQIQIILPDEPPSSLPDTVEEVKDNFTSPSYSNGSRESAEENIPFMTKEEWKQLNCLLAEDEAQKKFTDCLNLNKNLMNQIISEPEISQIHEVCHLNDEIFVNVKPFDVTEEQRLHFEKENRSLRSDLNDFKEIVSRQMEEILDLSKKNQYLHNKMELESIRAEVAEAESCRLRDVISKLRPEMDTTLLLNKIYQERLSDPKTEISCTGDQVPNFSNEMSIGSSILNMAEEQYIILREENNSLHSTVDEFKKIVARQEEEVTLQEDGTNKFQQSVEDEGNRQMIPEVPNRSLKKQHSLREEQVKLLCLEIPSGTETMRRMEVSRAELGGLKKLNDEDSYMNEKSFSNITKIGGLQDDVISSGRSKLKVVDETIILQEDLSYQNNKTTLEERYHELKQKIEEVNFNLASLRALISELHDWKHDLKGFNLKDLRLIKSTPEKEYIFDNSVHDVNAELELLGEKIKALEYLCESLHRDSPNHESQNTALVSHVEAAAQNIKKLSEKSKFVENSLSDIFVEFEDLRGKVKALDESCQSLFHQNCYLIAENSSLIAQVEKIEHDMQSLENRFSNIEGKYVNMETENDLFRSEKEGQGKLVCFLENQTSYLNIQIQTLREENKHLKEELEDEQHKTVKSGIDFCIMQNILYDMNEKNLFLLCECQMHLKKLRCAEKLASKFKQDQLMQEKRIALLLEHDKKLSEWMHLLLMAFDSKGDCATSEGGDKDMLQLISHKMVDLQVSVSDCKEEFHHFKIEKSPFMVLLEHLGLTLVELRAQKNVLQQESEKMNEQISVLHGKNYELMEVNEKLRKDFAACNQQKDALKIEMEEIYKKISELQVGQCISHGEIPELFAETQFSSNKLYESNEQKNVPLKGESQEMIHDHLSHTYSSDTEKSSSIDQLTSALHNLNGITNDLNHEITVENGNMSPGQLGNMHFGTKNVLPKELEKSIQILTKENARKDDEIDFLRQSNDKFVTESSIWRKKAEVLRRREKILTAELHRAKDESRHFEEESVACLFDVHVASINELVYEQKIIELVLKLKNLVSVDSVQAEMPVEEGSLRNFQEEVIMEKLHSLENENKELKEELTGYLPLVVSLDNDIASLEELTLSPANRHIQSSQKKQGNNVLAPHQAMKFSQVRDEDLTPTVSSGILVLKKLHAKVKLLQKAVSNTERILTQEETVADTNSLCKTRENKARRSKGSTSYLETEKKDIIFNSRKNNASDEDIILNQKVSNIKHEHITKDIELDHVLSITSDFYADTDEQAPNEDHRIEIMDEERSENHFSEPVLEKELSIDTIEMPENVSKIHQEWCTSIGKVLSSDALRLTILQKNVEEMKKYINGSELSTMNEQLKASETVIMQLTDINFKLARIADNFTETFDDDDVRRNISDRVQRAAEKIGEVDLELQNTKNSLLEIQEEEKSKEGKALQRKSRISFKGFFYGRRTDSRKKKRRFCACLGISNKDD